MKPMSPARSAAAFASLLFLAACQDGTPSPLSPDVTPSLERSQRAQDRLEQLFERSSPEVLDLPGTVYADNDESIGKLAFGIENMASARGVQNRLRALGIDEDDYVLRLAAPIRNVVALTDAFRPTQNGVQINFTGYVCTLGFNVDFNGVRSFITNSHCTNTQGGVESTQYWQASRTTNPEVVATEVQDPLYLKNVAGCSKGKKCRYSDASRAVYVPEVASTRGVIAQTTSVNSGSLIVAGTFTITSQDETTTSFASGTVVNKVGRTTGWTRGGTTQTCVNTNVSGSQVQLLCQTFVQGAGAGPIVDGGDSGSGVFTVTSGNNVRLVGILWGGSSDNKLFVFSPLKQIIQELAGTIIATN